MTSLKLYITILTVALVSYGCQTKTWVSKTTTQNSTQGVTVKADTSYLNIISPYKKKLDAEMNRVIGYSEKTLKKGPYQSTLGNFIIDLVLKKTEEYYGKDIDFALVTTGGLRTQLPKGEVTIGNIYELMPFENELVVQSVPGEKIKKLMDYTAKNGNTQFAGLKYELKDGKWQNLRINGQPFDESKTYTMAVSDYLANGGDGLEFLKECSYYQTGKMFRGAILDHLEDLKEGGQHIISNLDDRAVIIEDEEQQ